MKRQRLALIRVGDDGEFVRIGTGYLIAPRLVLTARHVVRESTGTPWPRIDVRVGHPRDADTQRCPAVVCWTHPDDRDVALLLLERSVEVPGTVRWGQPVGNDPLRYYGLGYPSAALKDGQRSVEQLEGQLPPQAGGFGARDLYVLNQVSFPGVRSGEQAWSGTSGAAVFCQDYLVGVVIHDDDAFENRRLHACPSRSFTDEPKFAELLQKYGDGPPPLVDISATRSSEAGLAPRDCAFRSHKAWIEQYDLLPDRLLDREDELRELEFYAAENVSGRSKYVWWQAESKAGKSALLAWFVMHRQPDNVDIVSYFIAERLANNNRDYFLSTVTGQLAALVGSEAPPPAVGRLAQDLFVLYQDAAHACAARGRTLLLVVDGLDEDGRSDGRSIAALLPKDPPPGMRVIVTGRPNPPVPDDVPDGHPLHDPTILRPLAASPEAGRVTERASRELQRLLDDEPLGNALLGLLTVAQGGLTDTDLAELTDTQPHQVRKRLRGMTGRSFVPDRNGHGLVAHPAESSPRHVLKHQGLRKQALEGLGDRAAAKYEAQLHAWADSYRTKGWPPGTTPLYLLYDYTRMLRNKGDTERLSLFVLDPRRQRALLDRSSVDTALSEVELARHVIERETPGDLNVLAAIAASRDILSERATVLPASIPLAFAWVGHPQRAMDLALASPHPTDKATRLAQVARVLAKTDLEHATQAAEEATRWAKQARQESTPSGGDEYDAEEAVGEAAVALIAVGEDHLGRDLLGSLQPHLYGGYPFQCEMAVEASSAARTRSPALAEELLDQAEVYAEEMVGGHLTDQTAPIQAWTVIAGAGPERAARLYERISEYAHAYPARLGAVDVLAAAASALVTGRPDDAVTLAQRAGQRLGAALRAPQSLPDDEASHLSWFLGSMLSNVARALVDTGRLADAQELVALVPDTMRTGPFGEDVLSGGRAAIEGAPLGARKATPGAESLAQQACQLAKQGKPDDAKARLQEAMESFAQSPEGTRRQEWLVPLAGALSTIGDPAAAEQLAKSLQGREQVRALAAVSISTAAAGHLAEARRLAHEAADRARMLEDTAYFFFHEGAPGMDKEAMEAAAQALAHAGERDPALSLADEVGRTDDGTRNSRSGRVLVAVAAGLRVHDPAAAAELIDQERERLLAAEVEPGGRRGRIAGLAELLVAIGGADRACRERLRREVGRMWAERRSGQLSVEDILVVVVLAARRQREYARSLLAECERSTESIPPWELPTGGFAIAHALFGDLAAAQRCASDHNAPYDRAEAFAAVAAYLAGTRADMVPTSYSGFPQTLLSLALQEVPPTTKSTDDAAHRFLATALAGDGWHHVLPLLARIAPEAVERVRDIVFTHRSL
ncbi:trypsin-like peptidase domain-containing protein [Streptomyces sp. NPDC056987]|uniref:trypsin-like peptidase domain-containing protein n=1 Tax=Streptomyces sp. NPDC056987 TaxID=3345988 RepID=UPI00364137BC